MCAEAVKGFPVDYLFLILKFQDNFRLLKSPFIYTLMLYFLVYETEVLFTEIKFRLYVDSTVITETHGYIRVGFFCSVMTSLLRNILKTNCAIIILFINSVVK